MPNDRVAPFEMKVNTRGGKKFTIRVGDLGRM